MTDIQMVKRIDVQQLTRQCFDGQLITQEDRRSTTYTDGEDRYYDRQMVKQKDRQSNRHTDGQQKAEVQTT